MVMEARRHSDAGDILEIRAPPSVCSNEINVTGNSAAEKLWSTYRENEIIIINSRHQQRVLSPSQIISLITNNNVINVPLFVNFKAI